MADEPKTDGTAVAEKAAPESAPAEKGATPGSGEKELSGVERRIAELTGEKNRLKTQLDELREKHKTDDEKRLDQIVNERYGPKLSRLDSLEQRLAAERDDLVNKIPLEHRGMVLVSESVPVEEQISQARSVLSFLEKSKPGSFAGGGSPGNGVARTYTKEQFEAWQNLPTIGKLKEYDEQKAEMIAAYKEKRVIGVTY